MSERAATRGASHAAAGGPLTDSTEPWQLCLRRFGPSQPSASDWKAGNSAKQAPVPLRLAAVRAARSAALSAASSASGIGS